MGIGNRNIAPMSEGSTLTFYPTKGYSRVDVVNTSGIPTYMIITAPYNVKWPIGNDEFEKSTLDRIQIAWPDNTSSYATYREDVRGPGKYSIAISWRGYQYYTETIEFILEESFTNQKPTIASTNTSQTVGANKTVTLTGTAQDLDNDTLTVSATINNIKKTQTIQGPVVNKPFTLSWQGSELSQGTYGTVHVTVNDTFETQTVNHIGVKTVDKIKPKLNISITK